jgi:hypothetical protein
VSIPSDDIEDLYARRFVSTMELHPEHLQAIGMISIEVGNLEMALGRLLGAMLHISPRVGELIYLTPQAAMARLSLLVNLSQDQLADDSIGRKMVDKLIERARTILIRRNDLIHNIWGTFGEEHSQVARQAVPTKDGAVPTPVAISDLAGLIDRIRNLGHDVRIQTSKILSEWPPYTWREKHLALPSDALPPASPSQENTPTEP